MPWSEKKGIFLSPRCKDQRDTSNKILSNKKEGNSDKGFLSIYRQQCGQGIPPPGGIGKAIISQRDSLEEDMKKAIHIVCVLVS